MISRQIFYAPKPDSGIDFQQVIKKCQSGVKVRAKQRLQYLNKIVLYNFG